MRTTRRHVRYSAAGCTMTAACQAGTPLPKSDPCEVLPAAVARGPPAEIPGRIARGRGVSRRRPSAEQRSARYGPALHRAVLRNVRSGKKDPSATCALARARATPERGAEHAGREPKRCRSFLARATTAVGKVLRAKGSFAGYCRAALSRAQMALAARSCAGYLRNCFLCQCRPCCSLSAACGRAPEGCAVQRRKRRGR